jgi:DNA primase
MSAAERKEAEDFGKSPDLIERILADFETCGLVGEEPNKLLAYLAATSRKTDEPLSLLVLSSSGAGKTALQDTALQFVPPEELVKLTSLSGKALFYKEREALKHKVLSLEEGDGAQEATYAIRNLISAGELVIESTIKDLGTGRLTTMENRVEGPTSVFITTTDPDTDPETKSRFFVTSIDEGREQTRAILAFQRQRQTLDGLNGNMAADAILKRHRNFQRLLKPVAVVNPFARKLAYGDDRLQGRRDQPKYLNLIKAVAFLRQMRKETHETQRNGTAVPYVLVDVEDVRVANSLAHEILGRSLDELSRPGRSLLLQLDEMVEQIIGRLCRPRPRSRPYGNLLQPP